MFNSLQDSIIVLLVLDVIFLVVLGALYYRHTKKAENVYTAYNSLLIDNEDTVRKWTDADKNYRKGQDEWLNKSSELRAEIYEQNKELTEYEERFGNLNTLLNDNQTSYEILMANKDDLFKDNGVLRDELDEKQKRINRLEEQAKELLMTQIKEDVSPFVIHKSTDPTFSNTFTQIPLELSVPEILKEAEQAKEIKKGGLLHAPIGSPTFSEPKSKPRSRKRDRSV